MATTQVVKIKVVELGKWGFKTEGSGNYIGYSKQIPEADKARVVPGAEFEAELYVADSGKEYLNKVLKSEAVVTAATTPPPSVDTARAKRFTPKFEKKADAISAGLSKDEWAAKDRRISRQGCIQAAVQALSPVISEDILMAKAADLAEQMLAFVNEVK